MTPAPRAAGAINTNNLRTSGDSRGHRKAGITPARRHAVASQINWATPDSVIPQASSQAGAAALITAAAIAEIKTRLSRIGDAAITAKRPTALSMPPSRATSEISGR